MEKNIEEIEKSHENCKGKKSKERNETQIRYCKLENNYDIIIRSYIESDIGKYRFTCQIQLDIQPKKQLIFKTHSYETRYKNVNSSNSNETFRIK